MSIFSKNAPHKSHRLLYWLGSQKEDSLPEDYPVRKVFNILESQSTSVKAGNSPTQDNQRTTRRTRVRSQHTPPYQRLDEGPRSRDSSGRQDYNTSNRSKPSDSTQAKKTSRTSPLLSPTSSSRLEQPKGSDPIPRAYAIDNNDSIRRHSSVQRNTSVCSRDNKLDLDDKASLNHRRGFTNEYVLGSSSTARNERRSLRHGNDLNLDRNDSPAYPWHTPREQQRSPKPTSTKTTRVSLTPKRTPYRENKPQSCVKLPLEDELIAVHRHHGSDDETVSVSIPFTGIEDSVSQIFARIPADDLAQRVDFLRANKEFINENDIMLSLEYAIELWRLNKRSASMACVSSLALLIITKDFETRQDHNAFFHSLLIPLSRENKSYQATREYLQHLTKAKAAEKNVQDLSVRYFGDPQDRESSHLIGDHHNPYYKLSPRNLHENETPVSRSPTRPPLSDSRELPMTCLTNNKETTMFESKASHSFQRGWSIPIRECMEYVHQELDDDADLSNLLILYEREDSDIGCVTCWEYLTERHDVALVEYLLRNIEKCIRSSKKDSGAKSYWNDDLELSQHRIMSMNYESSGGDLRIDANTDDIQLLDEVQETLAFLFSVSRMPVQEGFSLSQVELKMKAACLIEIRLQTLNKRFSTDSCWQHLFKQKVIYRNWPTDIMPYYGQGHILSSALKDSSKLEVSHEYDELNRKLHANLHTAMALVGADRELLIDNGLCFSGLFSLLIPISRTPDASRSESFEILWHVITLEPTDSAPRSRQKLLEKFISWQEKHDKRWFHTQQLSDLTNPSNRHVFAWVPEAKITLGASNSNYYINRTTAEPVSREILEKTVGVGIGLGYNGAGVSWAQSFKLGSGERSSHMHQDRNLIDILEVSTKALTLLYDHDKMQAWIVPEISVVLYATLACLYNIPGYYTPYDRSKSSRYRLDLLARLHRPQEPLKTLKDNLPEKIDLSPSDTREVKDIVTSVVTMLGQMWVSNIPSRNSRKFSGCELYDLIHIPKRFKVKKADLSPNFFGLGKLAGWHKILNEMSAVLFFSGIKDPIVPIRELCDFHPRHLPIKSNYLAITAESLLELLARHGSSDTGQLSKNAFWHCETLFGHIFQQPSSARPCELQFVTGRRSAAECPIHLLKRWPRGALIFCPDTGLQPSNGGGNYSWFSI